MGINKSGQMTVFEVIVCHISSLTSFSFVSDLYFLIKFKAGCSMISSLLITGKYDRYVANKSEPTTVSKQIRKETLPN